MPSACYLGRAAGRASRAVKSRPCLFSIEDAGDLFLGQGHVVKTSNDLLHGPGPSGFQDNVFPYHTSPSAKGGDSVLNIGRQMNRDRNPETRTEYRSAGYTESWHRLLFTIGLWAWKRLLLGLPCLPLLWSCPVRRFMPLT